MNDILNTLYFVAMFQPKTKSNYCRYNANEIAEASSRGYITVLNYGNVATNTWKLTIKGMKLLNESNTIKENTDK